LNRLRRSRAATPVNCGLCGTSLSQFVDR
jgi:ribosomal protein S27E